MEIEVFKFDKNKNKRHVRTFNINEYSRLKVLIEFMNI